MDLDFKIAQWNFLIKQASKTVRVWYLEWLGWHPTLIEKIGMWSVPGLIFGLYFGSKIFQWIWFHKYRLDHAEEFAVPVREKKNGLPDKALSWPRLWAWGNKLKLKGVNPSITLSKIKNDLERYEAITAREIAQIELKHRKRWFAKRPRTDVTFWFGRLPELITYKMRPRLESLSMWHGQNALLQNQIVEAEDQPSVFYVGRQGSGKTYAAIAQALSWTQGIWEKYKIQSDVVIVGSSKVQADFGILAEKLGAKIIDASNDKGLLQLIGELKRIEKKRQEIQHALAEHKVGKMSQLMNIRKDVSPTLIIMDDLFKYLGTDSALTKSEKERLNELVHALVPLITEGRTACVQFLFCAQGARIDELAFNLRRASSTFVISSTQSLAEARALAPEAPEKLMRFTAGQFWLSGPAVKQPCVIRAPFISPEDLQKLNLYGTEIDPIEKDKLSKFKKVKNAS